MKLYFIILLKDESYEKEYCVYLRQAIHCINTGSTINWPKNPYHVVHLLEKLHDTVESFTASVQLCAKQGCFLCVECATSLPFQSQPALGIMVSHPAVQSTCVVDRFPVDLASCHAHAYTLEEEYNDEILWLAKDSCGHSAVFNSCGNSCIPRKVARDRRHNEQQIKDLRVAIQNVNPEIDASQISPAWYFPDDLNPPYSPWEGQAVACGFLLYYGAPSEQSVGYEGGHYERVLTPRNVDMAMHHDLCERINVLSRACLLSDTNLELSFIWDIDCGEES